MCASLQTLMHLNKHAGINTNRQTAAMSSTGKSVSPNLYKVDYLLDETLEMSFLIFNW